MSRDSIGDFLTIIRNGVMAGKMDVVAPYSKMRFSIAEILKSEGFVQGVTVFEKAGDPYKSLSITLKYVDGESVIHSIQRISKPGCRVYSGSKQIKPTVGSLGISICTSSQGVMTDKKAKKLGIGGEIICSVW